MILACHSANCSNLPHLQLFWPVTTTCHSANCSNLSQLQLFWSVTVTCHKSTSFDLSHFEGYWLTWAALSAFQSATEDKMHSIQKTILHLNHPIGSVSAWCLLAWWQKTKCIVYRRQCCIWVAPLSVGWVTEDKMCSVQKTVLHLGCLIDKTSDVCWLSDRRQNAQCTEDCCI